MPLIDLVPRAYFRTCSILRDGVLTFPQDVLNRLGWQVPSRIAVTYINRRLTLLLRLVAKGEAGFALNYHYRGAKANPSGGKIKCTRFAREVLRARIVMPLRYVQPIYLDTSPYQMALLLESPEWVAQDFSRVGYQQIPVNLRGVYQLMDYTETVLRIGEGVIAERIKRHLQDERFPNVATVQYCSMTDKAESNILEKILIAQYQAQHGKLPPLNLIRA